MPLRSQAISPTSRRCVRQIRKHPGVRTLGYPIRWLRGLATHDFCGWSRAWCRSLRRRVGKGVGYWRGSHHFGLCVCRGARREIPCPRSAYANCPTVSGRLGFAPILQRSRLCCLRARMFRRGATTTGHRAWRRTIFYFSVRGMARGISSRAPVCRPIIGVSRFAFAVAASSPAAGPRRTRFRPGRRHHRRG